MKTIDGLKDFLQKKIEACEAVLEKKPRIESTGAYENYPNWVESFNPIYKNANDTREEAYEAIRMIREFLEWNEVPA